MILKCLERFSSLAISTWKVDELWNVGVKCVVKHLFFLARQSILTIGVLFHAPFPKSKQFLGVLRTDPIPTKTVWKLRAVSIEAKPWKIHCYMILDFRSYRLGCPLPSNSHYQDTCIFRRGSWTKASFTTINLGRLPTRGESFCCPFFFGGMFHLETRWLVGWLVGRSVGWLAAGLMA